MCGWVVHLFLGKGVWRDGGLGSLMYLSRDEISREEYSCIDREKAT